MPLLTKSNYLLGLQCPKLLFVAKNEKQRIPKPDEIALAKFKAGSMLGVLATKVFEEGVDLAGIGFKENLDKTAESIKKRKPIFEAGFLQKDLFSRVDILIPVGIDEWDIIEVKSGTSVKEINIHDVSFQKHVLEKAGLKIRNCILMHINNQYVKNGEIEPSELFIQTDITEEVKTIEVGIEERIENMLKIINSKEEPKITIGTYCTDPYECPLKNECWKEIPDENIFEFYRMLKKKTFELYGKEIIKIGEVGEDVKLNGKQKIQRRLAIDGGKHIDKLGINNFLNNLKYPIYYLDFETINPAIPKFDGMTPYQRIPFQFSLHVQDKSGGELQHVSFLAEGANDPRSKFLQMLKENLGETGSILVYNQGFEKGVLNECTDAFPEFKKWYEENIEPRIKDLWDVFKNFYFYDPRQKGSASIKAVLPVLSDLNYGELEIKKGDLASLEYERVTYGEIFTNEKLKEMRKEGLGDDDIKELELKEVKGVRDALEKYCELDTLAEVEIIEGLREEIE